MNWYFFLKVWIAVSAVLGVLLTIGNLFRKYQTVLSYGLPGDYFWLDLFIWITIADLVVSTILSLLLWWHMKEFSPKCVNVCMYIIIKIVIFAVIMFVVSGTDFERLGSAIVSTIFSLAVFIPTYFYLKKRESILDGRDPRYRKY